MHSHLDIKVNGKSLVIPEDSSLSVEEKNPLFNDVTFFSYPMQIPVEGNREVLKNIAHRDSNMRAMDLEHAAASIFADGLPLNHGQVITQDGSEIKDNFEFNIDAQQQSFSELIGDLECQDVKVKDRLVIGEKVGKMKLDGSVYFATSVEQQHYDDRGTKKYISQEKTITFNNESIESPQALGFSVPKNINVAQAYPFPYCNSRVAYTKPQREEEEGVPLEFGLDFQSIFQNTGSVYQILEANRQQSGVCFYVLYFLDCLFEQLGVVFKKDELLEIEDFKRLCFFTTKCGFDEEEVSSFSSIDAVNDWLSENNCGGKLELSIYTGHTRDIDSTFHSSDGFTEWRDLDEQHGLSGSIYDMFASYKFAEWPGNEIVGEVRYYRQIIPNVTFQAWRCNMIANSNNFPNASVSSVISSLENSFGIRFLYDPEKRIVTACLLRNIYKSAGQRRFNGRVLEMIPMTEKITGVRMAYSAESDSKEQQKNVRYGIKDYDTNFDYIEYPENRTITNLTYQQMTLQQGLISSTNKNVYIDKTTGNSYRIKINSDSEDTKTLKPVLFRVGQFKGVEEGDCSERNADYVKEFVSDFQPIVQNIINAYQYNHDYSSPIFAPFIDVDMEPANTEKEIDIVCVDFGKIPKPFDILRPGYVHDWFAFYDSPHLLMKETMTLTECYDPTQTDSGNSPLQDIDWGLTIAVMRGGGNNTGIENFDNNYDGFGNDKWRQTVGTYAISSDSVTPKGEFFDYNGQDPGLGGTHFSLCIRSWVQPSWADAPIVVSDHDIKDRGLYDMFMLPHAYFLLHRKPYKVKVLTSLAQLLDIRSHWTDRYVIDGKVGWINAIKYNVEKAQGVSETEIEFYAL